MVDSWGYGGYGPFHMTMWMILVIALVAGVVWRVVRAQKQPYYFTASDGSPLTIAGLWGEWKDIETGEPLKSCTMIITEANEFVSKTHDRMPVLLQKDFDAWLTGHAGVERLRPACRGG